MAFKKRESTQLREMDALKTRFFSNITHEFRTPLSLIIAPVDKLLADESLSITVQRSLATVLRNAQQLLNLINQVLDLSKLEAGKMTVTAVRGNIPEFVSQQLELFRPMAQQRQITLRVTADEVHTVINKRVLF